MSVRIEIYNSISAKLNELGILQSIDLFKGQMNAENNIYPTAFPCAFISIGRIAYENMTFEVKEGQVILEIDVFFNEGGHTFFGAEDKETSLEVYNQIDAIVKMIEGTKGDFFTEISQNGEEDLTATYQRPAFKLYFETLVYKALK